MSELLNNYNLRYREVDVCKSCGVEIDYVNNNDTLAYCCHCDTKTFGKKQLDDALNYFNDRIKSYELYLNKSKDEL